MLLRDLSAQSDVVLDFADQPIAAGDVARSERDRTAALCDRRLANRSDNARAL
jgi:hypothetical protein